MFSVLELHISETYNYQFDTMRGEYGSFCFEITHLVTGRIVTVDLLENLKEFVDDCYPELTSITATVASAKEVMKAIKSICNVINIAPVERVTGFCKIDEAKPLITKYSEKVDEFCRNLKIEFLEEKKLSTNYSLICETIEFVLDWDPADHLLKDIRRLIEKAFKGMSRRIIVRSMHKGNSIIIVCGAPTHLMSALQLEASNNLIVLQEEFSLIRLTIGHYTVYDKRINDKVMYLITYS